MKKMRNCKLSLIMIMPNGADNNEHNINSTMIDLMDISLSQSAPIRRLLDSNLHKWILQSDMGDYCMIITWLYWAVE